MTTDYNVHSRSELAGYVTEILFNAKVLICGVGALGQNTLLDLALAGIGNFIIVDLDFFEAHNATRSPLYPTREEVAMHGSGKAVNVAHRVARNATAPDPNIYWSDRPIQALGTGIIRWADVVVSAVDDLAARAWLTENCKRIGRPLIEGGFSGPNYGLSSFTPHPEDACYRCLNPAAEGTFSCSRVAARAEAAGIIPAIQTTAGALGGMQAEAVIETLHGNGVTTSRRVYGNLRTHTLRVAELPVEPECPGVHDRFEEERIVGLEPDDSVADVAARITSLVGQCIIELPEPIVLSMPCMHEGCAEGVRAAVTRAAWLLNPHCADHGGPYPNGTAVPYEPVHIKSGDVDDFIDVRCADVGLLPMTTVTVYPDTGEPLLMTFSGLIQDHLNHITD